METHTAEHRTALLHNGAHSRSSLSRSVLREYIMAKGLRSKGKRANRAQLRLTLSGPIIKKRAEVIAKSIKEGLENKKGVASIEALKSAFQAASSTTASAEEDMTIEEEEEEEEEEEDEGEEFKSKRTLAKEEFKKKRGSKARINPGKELVWFK